MDETPSTPRVQLIDELRAFLRRIKEPSVIDWSREMRGPGIEIGAHDLPIKGIHPIYVDRFVEFAGVKCLADVRADADALPFRRNSLHYVASSHLLEHLANPIRAFVDWYDVLKPGGLIYLLVPDRRFTFDHRRRRTSIRHIIDDFERGTTSCDPTHVDEYCREVDLAKLLPDLDAADAADWRQRQQAAYWSEVRAGRPINIHFHVFETEDIVELVQFLRKYPRTRFDWEVVDTRERFPPNRGDGFLVVIRVHKRRAKPQAPCTAG
jgi:SAM-dependent methyltransferase